MKRVAVLNILLLWSLILFGQNMKDIGVNNVDSLNNKEAELLNILLKEKRGDFNFQNKKVAFITGSLGNRILSKSSYFNEYVIPWIRKGSTVQILMVRLSEEERKKSGGYDAFVLSWVKSFSDKQKRRIISRIRQQCRD
ncbi:MAG TPA: hypothetical protein VM368_07370 [Flavisolibacter sp.]|nr:hypothetical protein [Flavisolibacter sp.]